MLGITSRVCVIHRVANRWGRVPFKNRILFVFVPHRVVPAQRKTTGMTQPACLHVNILGMYRVYSRHTSKLQSAVSMAVSMGINHPVPEFRRVFVTAFSIFWAVFNSKTSESVSVFIETRPRRRPAPMSRKKEGIAHGDMQDILLRLS